MSADFPSLDSCESCGACCRHMVAPPFIINRHRDETREKAVPAHLLEQILPLWEVRLVVAEAPCCWYDAHTHRCRHYDIRPDACRAFEINSPSCHACREKWEVPHPAR
ncbi:MAG: YkgJ family cysteine cluster protein [Planctomycetaceae bacterium]